MKKDDDVLIPKSVILRWLQESADADDFKRRMAHYTDRVRSNWTIGD